MPIGVSMCTFPTFYWNVILDLPEEDALKIIEQIVTKLINPAVHRKDFYTIKQSDTESTQDFLLCLQTASPDCEFTCPDWSYDLKNEQPDQCIRRLKNTVIQTDILTRARQLTTLEKTKKPCQIDRECSERPVGKRKRLPKARFHRRNSSISI